MKKQTMLNDVTLFWSKLDKPVSPFGSPQYDVQLRVNPEQKEILKGLNIKFRIEDDTEVCNVQRKATNAKGEDTPPVVVNGAKVATDPSLIGNGSKANVKLFTYPYTTKDGREGIKTILLGVQVTDLVEFTPDPVALF